MIINLTQHEATPEQVREGVVETRNKEEVRKLLTFEELPTTEEIFRRARRLAEIALYEGAEAAMIGGAPYLMGPLEQELRGVGVIPVYSFTERRVVEESQPDGTVRKVAVFRHQGFVEGAL